MEHTFELLTGIFHLNSGFTSLARTIGARSSKHKHSRTKLSFRLSFRRGNGVLVGRLAVFH
jgi:hypothetical protein